MGLFRVCGETELSPVLAKEGVSDFENRLNRGAVSLCIAYYDTLIHGILKAAK